MKCDTLNVSIEHLLNETDIFWDGSRRVGIFWKWKTDFLVNIFFITRHSMQLKVFLFKHSWTFLNISEHFKTFFAVFVVLTNELML